MLSHLDAVAARNDRVCKLVCQQGTKEQDRCDNCRDHIGHHAVTGKGRRQLPSGESRHQDGDDQKDAGVDSNLDASDAAERDGRSHFHHLRTSVLQIQSVAVRQTVR
jgi:hypothetical protein